MSDPDMQREAAPVSFLDRLKNDFIFLTSAIRVLNRVKDNHPDSPHTTAEYLEKWAVKRPDATAIVFEDRTVTWKQWESAANKYARWAMDHGVRRGDVVAILMENRPEYLFAWLGLAKIGAISALINTHLRDQSLAHCLDVAHAKHLVLGHECAANYASAAEFLSKPVQTWVTGGPLEGARPLDVELSALSGAPLPDSTRQGMTAKDVCFYIYTSGTTGLPKAARLTHYRVLNIMNAFAAATKATSADRMYVAMPLYHSAGGVAALGPVYTVGGTVVLRREFSATAFWSDCVRTEATMFQYIGELCRYLLNAPDGPEDDTHKIRIAVGNGLRPELWNAFQSRFKIPRILEFYGATEGNVLLFNFEGKPGAIGRLPWYLRHRYRYLLVKFDIANQRIIRDVNGHCIEAETDEVGECLGAIYDLPRSRFEGYNNKDETERKIVRDVFEDGDAWFRTGDLMRKDAQGYFYFVHRIGDTYRWKGENVSTQEVEQVLAAFDGIQEVNVYGVAVPGAEGRAGMASIVARDGIDPKALYDHVQERLPDYAQPLFLRIRQKLDTTGTLKLRKMDLVEGGVDTDKIDVPLFVADVKARIYVQLDADRYGDITGGQMRF